LLNCEQTPIRGQIGLEQATDCVAALDAALTEQISILSCCSGRADEGELGAFLSDLDLMV
jgi:hypothetical protein